MNLQGLAIDWMEALADRMDDPAGRPAGWAEPLHEVSEHVTVSRDHGVLVYHLANDQLGQGASFGNGCTWLETRGNGSMLSLFNLETGVRVIGGLSISYLVPFADMSLSVADAGARTLTREVTSSGGVIHLHPAFQQHEFVIGDGLHCLETVFVPRVDHDDPCGATTVVAMWNRTRHPLRIALIASLDLRGGTPHDLTARFMRGRRAVVAPNASHPEWVRVFGSRRCVHYVVTPMENSTLDPGVQLPDRVEGRGDLTAALQFNMTLLPGQRRQLPITVAFSPRGVRDALANYDRVRASALADTVAHYRAFIDRSVVEAPELLMTQAVQWAKACILRPIGQYSVGTGVTNDPGNSSALVARDTSWYTLACDYIAPDEACSMLKVFAAAQRDDGLIPESLDGRTGSSLDFAFNVNDGTALFARAVAHHLDVTDHSECADVLYPAAKHACDVLLQNRTPEGLVYCTADGIGIRGICGWRNILRTDQISGVVTEMNALTYGALRACSDVAARLGYADDASRLRGEAERLRVAINQHLLDRSSGLYVRNIELSGSVHNQVTIDEVFPLIFGVADDETSARITARLSEHDFMSDGGIRALSSADARWDPSFDTGLRGGVWSGATWWYAMGARRSNPALVADALRRAYSHVVRDPKTFNTVPGQFSEWSDGQTLVNRGMRLSPWDAPRFLWAVIEGVAGICPNQDSIELAPGLPPSWHWLRVENVLVRGRKVSFFLTREGDKLHAYTSTPFEGNAVTQHPYESLLPHAAETIAAGVSLTAFRRDDETLLCLGNRLEIRQLGPFLAHHSIDTRTRYQVIRLASDEGEWHDLGVFDGGHLQRMAARLEGGGYALYRFLRVKA
jgi:glycogen debranching enzyme